MASVEFHGDTTDLEKTSHSEVELFTKCERAHYYRYGMGITGSKVSEALARGIAGHAALADYYTNLKNGMEYADRVSSALDVVVDEIDTSETFSADVLMSELVTLLMAYFARWRARDEALEVLDVEKEFLVPVGDNFFLKMYIDLIVRMPGVGLAVWDHKFMKDFYNPDIVDLNPQLPKYLGALTAAGYDIRRAYYNEIRYRTTKANEADSDQRFRLTSIDITRERIINTMAEQIKAARRIRALRNAGIEVWEQKVLRAANSFICSNCAFKEICALDLNNKDTTLAVQYQYKHATGRDKNS